MVAGNILAADFFVNGYIRMHIQGSDKGQAIGNAGKRVSRMKETLWQ